MTCHTWTRWCWDPPDTPYDAALLHFQLKILPSYPMNPPEVRFLTTDSGTLRLHPQLYADGKVCLSILGTWHGPRWSASSSIRAVLLSIQSLLCEDPLRCEPGMESATDDKVELANVFVVHESVRVGILSMLENGPSWDAQDAEDHVLTLAARAHLPSRVDTLLSRLSHLATRFDGQVIREPFLFGADSRPRSYDFSGLAKRLQVHFPTAPAPLLPKEGTTAGTTATGPPPVLHAEEDLCCRICHLTAEESDAELIEPCQCAGSIRCAHSSCLIDWLKHTGAAQAREWRCDLCLAAFRVESMPGEPPGGRLLQRSPLEFVDFQVSSECSGLVSVLLTSTSQTLFMCLGTGVANILYLVANIVLSPAAPAAYDLLKWPLALPAMMVDLAFQFLYAILVVMKVSMLVSGWKSRPAVWFEVQEQLLIWAAEMLTLLCNLRLSGLLALAGYFTGDHLCRTCLGINSLLVIEWPLLGRKPDIWSLTGFMMRANSPAQILRNVVASSLIYQALGLVSALVNLVTIVLILKAAFLDARWVPVAILPAEGKLKKA
ncbi:unnamed protein product [Durusdinium trenchii]|uniref:Ubiquitin-conjugating enzyme E2 Z n=1 Tax=Durusdinium trenchii TaxID=1381693 RepID=A0ABP0KKP8_9DINO